MNINYSLLVLLTSLFFVTPSYAVDITDTYSWDSGEGSGVYYRVNNKDSLQKFYAQINHSKDGQQRLYFYNLDLDVLVVPEDIESRKKYSFPSLSSNRNPITTTMVFDGQAIKMNRFYEIYYETQKYYSYYTPATEAGHTYLVNLFKKARSPIKIQYNDQTFHIPSKGFTRIWNSSGGDAI